MLTVLSNPYCRFDFRLSAKGRRKEHFYVECIMVRYGFCKGWWCPGLCLSSLIYNNGAEKRRKISDPQMKILRQLFETDEKCHLEFSYAEVTTALQIDSLLLPIRFFMSYRPYQTIKRQVSMPL